MLNGFDRNRQEGIHQADLFLVKGFTISNAAKRAVKTRHRFDACTNFLLGWENVLASFMVSELRFIGEDGGEFLFKLLADVDHECRPDIVVKRRVDDLERSVRS